MRELFAPLYYSKFICRADNCQNSCCIGWRVGVDDESLAGYERMQGELGERIRKSLENDDDGVYIRLHSTGRCPHLTDCGLCEIICALGPSAVPEICREHPRFYNLLSTHTEVGIGASCEAAAELIIGGADYRNLVRVGSRDDIGDNMDFSPILLRDEVFRIIDDAPDARAAVDALATLYFPSLRGDLLDEFYPCFQELEYTSEENERFILSFGERSPSVMTDEVKSVLSYLVYRHATSALSEREFAARVILAALGTKVIESLAVGLGDTRHALLRALRIFSLEIEYSEDNTESLIFDIECAGI